MSQRVGEMTALLDEKSNGLLAALSGKGQEFASEVSRVTDQAVKSIEAKSFVFTQTMMDNSEEIARLINDASQTATTAMTRTLGQLQEGAQGVAEAAKTTITRTLDDLHERDAAAIEESKQTASATVADMLETHNMLRSDTTALFERLREANILLQEVLSGAHENMNSIEHTMVTRVSEFVAAMNDLSCKSGTTTAKVEAASRRVQHHDREGAARSRRTGRPVQPHGRSLAEAVELLEKSNRRTEEIDRRRGTPTSKALVIDARRAHRRLRAAAAALLGPARRIARCRDDAGARDRQHHRRDQQRQRARRSSSNSNWCARQSEEERKRTGETLNAVYDEAADAGADACSRSPPSASPTSCRA